MQTSLFERESLSTTAPRPMREYQIKALEAIREAIREGHKRIVLQCPTGAGKTRIAAEIIQSGLSRGRRSLFTCPAVSLIDQTVKSFKREGIWSIGVMQADHPETNPYAPVQVASIHTLVKREVPDVHFCIVDECFPGETLVATIFGPKRIDQIKVGEAVHSAHGIGLVVSLFNKPHRSLVKVNLSNGTHFRCTNDHPIFTSKGWKAAGKLDVGERLYRQEDLRNLWSGVRAETESPSGLRGGSGAAFDMEQETFLRTSLSAEIHEGPQGQLSQIFTKTLRAMRSGIWPTDFSSGKVLLSALLQQLLRENGPESDAHSRDAGEGIAETTGDGTRTQTARGKRAWDDASPIPDFDSFGRRLEMRIGSEDSPQTRRCIPSPLQVRLGELILEALHRVRRIKPCIADPSGAGPEEGRTSTQPWVESVETEELACEESVYNLRVAGHPSYFANGVLVHNCHESREDFDAILDSEGWKDMVVIGLSATPWKRGMGLRWTKLIIGATIGDMIAEAWLSPFIAYVPEHQIDRSKLKVAQGEFTEGSAADAMSVATIVGDAVKEWQEKWGQGKTFMFCVNRNHAKVQMDAFNEAGIACGYIDAYTELDEAPPSSRSCRRRTQGHRFGRVPGQGDR